MTNLYAEKIKMFFNPLQVLKDGMETSTSKSPLKPLLLKEYLGGGCGQDLMKLFQVEGDFQPFSREDFLTAHTREYVDAVFEGAAPLCRSNGLPWSEHLPLSVCYTNASLYNAIREAVVNPGTVTFSPTSGFHHARPNAGGGFCTFSGQVIASVKLHRELGKRACYLDLDGHYGNSIEDSRDFVPELSEAIPVGFNINPSGYGATPLSVA